MNQDTEEGLVSILNHNLDIARESILYSKKLKNTKPISSLDDFLDVPFTTKQELRETFPYGNLAVDQSEVIEVHTSSGTTGAPTASFFTKKDLEEGSKAIAQAWSYFGVGKNSRLQFMMNYGMFSGAMLNTYAIQETGALVVPAGLTTATKQLDLMKDFDVDTVVATPSYLYYLYEHIKEHEIDITQFNLEKAIVAGEVYSVRVREDLEKLYSIQIFDHYGLCEVNTGIAYECRERKGLHVLREYVYPEIISTETQEKVSDGKPGELVLTSLKKQASPVIRYRTGDVSSVQLESCGCGSLDPLIKRIESRVDDDMFVRGLKINPHELKDLLADLSENLIYPDIKIQIPSRTSTKRPRIKVVLRNQNNEHILVEVAFKIKEKIGVWFDIEAVDLDYFQRGKENKQKFFEYVN